MTSLKGKDLGERHSQKIRLRYLPIFPSAAHPDLGVQLFIKYNRKLRKNSYVQTNQVTIEQGALREYDNDGTRYILRADSFKYLLAYVKNFASASTPQTLLDISLPPFDQHLPSQRPDDVHSPRRSARLSRHHDNLERLPGTDVLSSSIGVTPVRRKAIEIPARFQPSSGPYSTIHVDPTLYPTANTRNTGQAPGVPARFQPSYTTFTSKRVHPTPYLTPNPRETWQEYASGISVSRRPLLPVYQPMPEPESHSFLKSCVKLIKSTFALFITAGRQIHLLLIALLAITGLIFYASKSFEMF